MRAAKKIVIFLVLLACLILIYFLIRTPVLNFVVKHKINSIKQKYHLEIQVGSLKMFGPKSIEINDLKVVSEIEDTILQANNIELNPGIFRALFGQIQLKSLVVEGLDVRMNSNILELWLNRRNQDTLNSADKFSDNSYSNTLSRLEKQLFVTIPGEIDISNASFRYQREDLFSILNCEHFKYSKNVFGGTFWMQDNNSRQAFIMNGTLDKSNHNMKVLISQIGHNQVKLPYIGPRWQADLASDSLFLQTSFNNKGSDLIEINGGRVHVKIRKFYLRVRPKSTSNEGVLGIFGYPLFACST